MTRIEAQLQQLTEELSVCRRDTARARLYLKRAYIYIHAKDVPHALRDVRDALRHASSHPALLVRAARILVDAQHYEKAKRVLDAAEHRAPSASDKALILTLRAKLAHPSPAASLPVEVLVHVLGHLPPSSLPTCMLVCRAWHAIMIQHRPLWHTVAVRAPVASEAHAARAQYEAAARYLRRGLRHVRNVCLRSPLTDHRRVWSLVAPLRLTTLDITCDSAQAPDWFAWACAHATLESLTLRATTPKGLTNHPWLAPPLTVRRADARFAHLALHGTPPLAADALTLAVCTQLQSLVYDAGDSLHALQNVQARCAPVLQTLWLHAQHTLTTVELRGAAWWVGAGPLPLPPHASLRSLQRLCAPLSCLGAHAELPVALSAWETTLPAEPALADRAVALAAQCAPTLHTCTLHVSHAASTPLAERLLAASTALTSLYVVVDEAVAPGPLVETYAAAQQCTLTPATVLRLLTPGCWTPRVLCPKLHTLGLVHDTTVRGRELMDMVGIRSLMAQGHTCAAAWATHTGRSAPHAPSFDVEQACEPLVSLDIDTCLELAAPAVSFVQAHVKEVHWSLMSVARARLLARLRHEPRGWRARAGS